MSKALVIKGADFSINKVSTITFEGKHTTEIQISQQALTFNAIGETQTLTATIIPADSVDAVSWTTSDASVATVNNGTVTAVGIGTCIITASSGAYSAECTVENVIYLSGVRLPKTLTDPIGSGNNAFTRITCDIGSTSTNKVAYLSMMDGEETFGNKLLCGSMAVNVADTGYDFQIVQPDEMSSSSVNENIKHTYDAIGYPIPMEIPTGTKKIKCIGLNEKYGAHPLFFNSKQRALDTNENVNGAQYYIAFRQKYTPTADDYTWVYENNLVFDVPDGFDSVVVVWKADTSDADVILPANLTAEQLAEFKVLCM